MTISFDVIKLRLKALGLSLLREWRFKRKYRVLLHTLVAQMDKGNRNPGDQLSVLKTQRRKVPSKISEWRVVAFGTDDDWRRNGIWAGFRNLTDFSLFEVPDGSLRRCKSSDEERDAKQIDFLKFIKIRDETAPVHLAVFSHSGRHISDGLISALRAKGIWTIVMSVDDQHQFLHPTDKFGVPHQLRVAGAVDLYWTNWRAGVGFINSLGGNAWYAPPAADPTIYVPTNCSRDLDIVFIGTRYGVREKIIADLRKYFSVYAFGNGWENGPVLFDETIRLYNRAKIVLGIGGVGPTLAIQTLKGRDFEVPMCGATYLTSAYSELAEHFNIGSEILFYSSIENCIEVVATLLPDKTKCHEIGQAARKRSVESHTWDARISKMFSLWKQ